MPTEESVDHLLTVEDAAKRLNVSVLYLRELIRSGQLPYVSFGHKTKRVTAQALDNLIRRKTMSDSRDQPKRKIPRANLEAAHRALREKRELKKRGLIEKITSLKQAEGLAEDRREAERNGNDPEANHDYYRDEPEMEELEL